jgi:23S rRNA pseudouridine2605 synthase
MVMAGEKLHKVLAGTGLGSRRQIEKWIAEGRISVDGEVARVGLRVDADARISLDGKHISTRLNSKTRVLIYHKPLSEICTRSDPRGRPTVFDQLPKVDGRWIAVGRLDINTTGLLLFTNDGALASKLMHPSSGYEREYIVRVHGVPTPEQLTRLRSGVMLDGNRVRFNTLQPIKKRSGTAMNQWYRVVVSEGRNREIRRLWEKVGCQVNQLKRIRYGPVSLPQRLPPGQWQELDPGEIVDAGAAD